MAKIFNKTLTPSESVYDGRLLDPREIRINAEFNGRHDLPGIEDLLAEFQDQKIGQLFPVLITKDDDGAPLLLDGHRRYRAAIKLTEEKKGFHEGGVFRLKCQYFKGTPLECFVATVKANTSRKESLPIDDGYNISRLVNNFGMSHEDIAAKVYGRFTASNAPDVAWVKEREALSELAAEAAEALGNGRIAPKAVMELAKISKKAQRDLLKSTSGKITVAAVKRAASPVPQSGTTGTAPNAPAKRQTPKAKDICAIIDRYLGLSLPPHILAMTPQGAVNHVLREIADEIECGQ